MTILSSQLEGAIKITSNAIKTKYIDCFLSGKESPEEFVRDYESKGWLRRHLLVSSKFDNLKYKIAQEIISQK